MAYCMSFGKLLFEPVLTYCQCDPKQYIEIQNFPFKKMYLKMSSANCKITTICLDLSVMNYEEYVNGFMRTAVTPIHWSYYSPALSLQYYHKTDGNVSVTET